MGAWRPKHVEWPCINKTCTVLHQVGVPFDLYYDAREHKIKILHRVCLLRGTDCLFQYSSGTDWKFCRARTKLKIPTPNLIPRVTCYVRRNSVHLLWSWTLCVAAKEGVSSQDLLLIKFEGFPCCTRGGWVCTMWLLTRSETWSTCVISQKSQHHHLCYSYTSLVGHSETLCIALIILLLTLLLLLLMLILFYAKFYFHYSLYITKLPPLKDTAFQYARS